jgi:hypothetical protein
MHDVRSCRSGRRLRRVGAHPTGKPLATTGTPPVQTWDRGYNEKDEQVWGRKRVGIGFRGWRGRSRSSECRTYPGPPLRTYRAFARPSRDRGIGPKGRAAGAGRLGVERALPFRVGPGFFGTRTRTLRMERSAKGHPRRFDAFGLDLGVYHVRRVSRRGRERFVWVTQSRFRVRVSCEVAI